MAWALNLLMYDEVLVVQDVAFRILGLWMGGLGQKLEKWKREAGRACSGSQFNGQGYILDTSDMGDRLACKSDNAVAYGLLCGGGVLFLFSNP